MTTGEIETLANPGMLANSDSDVKSILRFNIIPDFLDAVGDVAMNRKTGSVTTEVGVKDYALPDDFLRMRMVKPALSSYGVGELKYRGSDEQYQIKYANTTENNKPDGYVIVADADGELKTIRFSCPADAEYTFNYTYTKTVPFKNDADDVDLDAYIPRELQWALVEGLKAEIFFDRFGEGDSRYITATQKYDRWVSKAKRWRNREPARHGRYHVYAS